MQHPKARAATYADLEALPANVVGEIPFGVLHAHPRPAPRHAVASSRLGMEIGGPFDRGRDGPGGWVILDEPELHPGPNVVVPDIAGWRRERLPRLPETAWVETAPDWVCEVLSPATARIDRTDKLAIYCVHGVGHAWYVDPLARTLEVFTLVSGAGALSAPEAPKKNWQLAMTFKDDEAVAAPPFEVHTFNLDVL